MKNVRGQFEKTNGRITNVTTIAPTPEAGRTLKDMGWEFVIRDTESYEVVERRNADEERRRILRGFGHKC